MLSSAIGIPYEILDRVLGYLDQGDVLSLSQTSHQFRSEELLRKSIYQDLINARDVPLGSNARKYKQWRSRIEYLFKGLDPQTGAFVKRIAIPDHMTYEKLVKILQYCTNLEHVDFTGVEDSIESSAVRNDLDREYVLAELSKLKLRQASEPLQSWTSSLMYWNIALRAPPHGIRWSATLEAYPELFGNLKSVAVNFDLCFCHDLLARPTEDHAIGLHSANCLPYLLKAAPKLESLTLYAKRSYWPHSLPQRFRKPFGSYPSQCLTTITLVDFRMNLLYFGASFWSWDIFKHLEVLKISLHSDICGLARQDRCGSIYLLRYVESLMAACFDRDFTLQSFDASESANFAVPLQSSLIRLQMSHLRFLRGIGWQPMFDWTDLYLVTCSITRHWPSSLQINQNPHMWRSALGDFLDRLEQTGIPIRVQLGPYNTQGLFFPDPKKMQPRPIDVFPNPDISKWLLQDFGHRFDEISILWDPTLTFPEINLEPNNAYEMRTIAAALLNSHQTSQQCDYEILETLAREAYGASQLFEKIQTWFPKIRRLALYIPAAIYPSTDQAFVDNFLSCNENETWEVQHHGSGGGIERTADSPREYHMGHPYEMNLAIRRYETSISPSEVLHKAVKCSMIHRVFCKKPLLHESGNSKYLKPLNTERNNRYPPHPPTVTDLLLDKDHWTEKPWMVLLIKYCRCNGFSSAHVPKGKKNFSLETATLEELRQVAQAVFDDVLYT